MDEPQFSSQETGLPVRTLFLSLFDYDFQTRIILVRERLPRREGFAGFSFPCPYPVHSSKNIAPITLATAAPNCYLADSWD